jgi:hypothetical protein
MAKITHCMKNKMQGIVAPHKVETSTITMPGGFYFSLYRDFLQGVYPKISNHDLGMILGNNPLEEYLLVTWLSIFSIYFGDLPACHI